MALQGALLGLISSQGPITGYDLTKTFRLSMSHYWHARHGQIYPTLETLKRQGLVNCRKQIQHDRPNKKLYTITPKGRGQLLRWLQSPLRPLQMKHEALLKTRFYAYLPSEQAIARLREERGQNAALLDRYHAIEREHFGTPKTYRDADTMFAFFTLQRGIIFLESSIRWCDWATGEVERFKKTGKATRRRPPRLFVRSAS